jgi:uncharacterized membrane protein
MRWIAAFIAGLAVFAALDLSWLSFANARFYTPVLGPLLSGKIDLGAAAAFYLVYFAGLMFLAVAPAIKAGSLGRAALNGAVYGLCAYGTYDLTCQATMKVWATKITLMDMGWGLAVSTVGASAAYLVARALSPKR